MLLEHGIGYGVDSDSWEDVQEGVSKETRVCRYDRADVGESDDAKPGRSMPDLAEDLVELMTAAKIAGPYIVVGHSFGGLTVRYFALLHPKSVVGMVLVDGSAPYAIEDLNLGSEQLNHTKVMSQLNNLKSLGHIPLIVITRGIGARPLWKAAQAAMVKLSTAGRQVIATKSDHWIQLREPDLVIRQIPDRPAHGSTPPDLAIRQTAGWRSSRPGAPTHHEGTVGMTAQLTSWNDTPTRQAIVDFVGRVTRDGGPDFVPPEERIAVFDNDGTLWLEKPLPPELGFVLLRLAADGRGRRGSSQAPAVEGRRTRRITAGWPVSWPPTTRATTRTSRCSWRGMVQAFADMTVDDYQTAASAFLHKGTHPTLGRVFRDVWYADGRAAALLSRRTASRTTSPRAGTGTSCAR